MNREARIQAQVEFVSAFTGAVYVSLEIWMVFSQSFKCTQKKKIQVNYPLPAETHWIGMQATYPEPRDSIESYRNFIPVNWIKFRNLAPYNNLGVSPSPLVSRCYETSPQWIVLSQEIRCTQPSNPHLNLIWSNPKSSFKFKVTTGFLSKTLSTSSSKVQSSNSSNSERLNNYNNLMRILYKHH